MSTFDRHRSLQYLSSTIVRFNVPPDSHEPTVPCCSQPYEGLNPLGKEAPLAIIIGVQLSELALITCSNQQSFPSQ